MGPIDLDAAPGTRQVTDPARTIAEELHRRGLAIPARLFIDAHRPMTPLLADLGAALGPLLRAFGVAGAAGGVAAILADPDGLDRLIAELEPRPSEAQRADA